MSSSASQAKPKIVVVFGATGNIGKPFVQALSGYNTNPSEPLYDIVALSRNPESSSSKKLAALPGVRVIKAADDNQDRPLEALSGAGFKKGDIYGLFSVQGYVSYKQDIAQGKAIADATKELGAKHLIYLSTDFGGVENTGTDDFERKRVVENHIKSIGIPYTFLHPVQFMDNLLPNSTNFMKLARTMLIHNTFRHHPERKHQMVSCRDIGRSGAIAIHEPEKWLNRDFVSVGDEFTIPELLAIYRDVMGQEPTYGNTWFTAFGRRFVPIPRNLANFHDDLGYHADLEAVKKDLPDVEDLRTFLQRYKQEQGI